METGEGVGTIGKRGMVVVMPCFFMVVGMRQKCYN
jgi:hypothetical protein